MTPNDQPWPSPNPRPESQPTTPAYPQQAGYPGQNYPPSPPPGSPPPGSPPPGPPPGSPPSTTPNFGPSAHTQQAPYQAPTTAPFGAPPSRGGSKGGQRALLAGVLGGLVVLGAIAAGALWFTGGDDQPEPTIQPLVGGDSTTSSPAETTVATVDRIGTTIGALDLRTGDCLNYEANNGSVTEFDVVSCDTPHLVEIAAQHAHPGAGGGFPGVGELLAWGTEPCTVSAQEFLGVDVSQTTLTSSTLVPDFAEWSDGVHSISCLIGDADGGTLSESVSGKGSSYPRSSDVIVSQLRRGDCFLPAGGLTAFELGVSDLTTVTPCTGPHDGLFFGRAELDSNPDAPFPGEDVVDVDGLELCNNEFTDYFGLPHDGFNFRYWTPVELQWTSQDRTVHCAIIDERGLPANLDFASFRPMFQLPVGQCFLLAPEETPETMGLDDQAEPVDCSQEHNGEVFGLGELPSTSDPYPGADALDEQTAQTCVEIFTGYVGISPFDSTSGDFFYWYASDTGWDNGDLRWACALLTEETSTGTIEGTNS